MKPDYIAIGKRVKERRRELRVTQEKLAEQVDTSIPHAGQNVQKGKAETDFALP